MALSASAALWFLPGVIPIALWVAWSDLSAMRIPNKTVYLLVAVYAVTGLIALPLETYLWHWVHLLVVLAVGFVLNIAGLVGGGDAKFAAAMAPFIALGDLGWFLVLFSVSMLSALACHRAARAVPALRNLVPHWESWTRKEFPMGLPLAASLVFYLALVALRAA
ncbi:prepilin peptidase [Actibacterium ureilyticum]|uniref:prepilin peptidase n=1 Tax=Actibacterium ureilyticum TaxID=1590614 RepID=UPI000BAB1A6F|nr:prepilin peptidase [Actibacterium ureilyticum]